jgi:hypothetical protein
VITARTRTFAIKLLENAYQFALDGEADPVVVAARECGISYSGKAWALAYDARVEACKRRRRRMGPRELTSQRTIMKAIELLTKGWAP